MKAQNQYHGGTKIITSQESDNITRFFDEIRSHEQLTKQQEKELIIKWRKYKDEKALDKLIKCNLRFLVTIAKTYQGTEVPLMDIIQEGSVGMIEAATRFDIKQDIRFCSYAVWWIKRQIMVNVDFNKRLIQLPANRTLLITKVKRVMQQLENKLQRQPTIKEINKHFKDQSSSDIEEAIAFNLLPISLFGQILDKDGSEGDTQLIDTLNLPHENNVDQEDIEASMQIDLNKLLYQLPQRQYDVLVLSWGLNEEPPHRNEELGKLFNVKDKDIIKIRAKAVKILQKYKDQTKLNEYL